MKRIGVILFLLGWPVLPAHAGNTCLSQSSVPTFQVGQSVPSVCDTHGTQKVMTVDQNGAYVAGGGGGGGDASAANQLLQNDYLDGVEGLITSTNSKLDTLNTSVNTELPAAAALADDTANPTVPGVASFNMCFDGSTWDRCVKGTGGAGTVDANTTRTTEATDSQLSAGVGAAGDAAVTAGSTGSITGKLRQISSDIDAIKTAVQLIDDDQTGASLNHKVSAGTTEDETEIKATAGRLLSIQITNSAATVAYFRCANLTAANTTPGTSTVFYGLAVPGATTGAGITANFGSMGVAFSTALTCWVVTGKAETDVAEVGANDIQWNIQYK